MRADIASQIETALNRLMLPASRAALCAPVIAAAPAGIDGQTWPVLHTLGRLGPLSAARLADEIGIDRSGASRYADRLVELGYARRTSDPLDRRAVLIVLTEEGRRLIDELNARLADHLHEMIRAWPRGQAEALVDGLERVLAWGRSSLPPSADERDKRDVRDERLPT